MRIDFANTVRAKSLAKNLKKLLSEEGREVSLGESQSMIAAMFGYCDWQELSHAAGSLPPSADDSECDVATVRARRLGFVDNLSRCGVAPELARRLIDALHPTAVARRDYSDWTPHHGGIVRADGQRAYLIRDRVAKVDDPFFASVGEPLRPIALKMGSMEGGTPRFSDRLLNSTLFETVEDAKAHVQAEIDERRIDAAEAAELPGRTMRRIDPEDLSAADRQTRWGEADYAMEIAPGLIEYGTPRHGGVRVSPELLLRMPFVLRNDADERGYAWYEEDGEAAMVRVAFPEFFTATERRHAAESLRRNYRAVADIVEGKVAATPAAIRRARKSYTGPNFGWGFVRPPDDDGVGGLVRATVMLASFWGDTALIEGVDHRKEWVFLVPRSEVPADGQFRHREDEDDDILPYGIRIDEEVHKVEVDGVAMDFFEALELARRTTSPAP